MTKSIQGTLITGEGSESENGITIIDVKKKNKLILF